MNLDNRVLTMTPEDVVSYFAQSPHLAGTAEDVAKVLGVKNGVSVNKTGQGPSRWNELSQKQQAQVEQYISTLLAQQLPLLDLIEKPGREVVEQRAIGSVSYQLEKIKCGKGCKGCPHGPYWYGYYRKKGKTVSEYIGKQFKRIDGLM